VKTRTLLLLAVACAFVILIAGSIKIFLIADEKPAEHLRVGQSGVAGDMRVTVLSATERDGQLVIGVRIGGIDDIDGATSFKFGNGGKDFLTLSDSGTSCAATTVAEAECDLAFDTTDPNGVLLYERTSEDVVRWDIGGG
jgi:L-ascorbate metabolism protein UlaG (beta-lactamase superfamily)